MPFLDEKPQGTEALVDGVSAPTPDSRGFGYAPLAPEGGIDLGKQPERQERSWTEIAGAAFDQENVVVNTLRHLNTEKDFGEMDTSYDPWGDIEGTKYEQYWQDFTGSRNRKNSDYIKGEIDRELGNRKVLEDAGPFWGTVFSMGASVLDAPTLIPVGGAFKAANSIRSLSRSRHALAVGATTAAVGAPITALTEGALHGMQYTRTMEESLFNVGGSVLLGGLFGGGLGFMRGQSLNNSMQAMAKRFDQEATYQRLEREAEAQGTTIDDILERVGERRLADNPELRAIAEREGLSVEEVIARASDDEDIARIIGENRSEVGAAILMREQNLIKSALGVENLLRKQDPTLRLLTSEYGVMRDAITRLTDTVLTLRQNKDGIASGPVGGNVEARIRFGQKRLFSAIREAETQFQQYYFKKPAKFAAVRAAVRRKAGGDQRLTWVEFKQEVGRAMRNNDQSDIPEIQKAAQGFRKEIFEPLGEEAVRLGYITQETLENTAGDLSYLTRVFDREAIKRGRASPGGLRDILTRWFEEGQFGARNTINRKRADLAAAEARTNARRERQAEARKKQYKNPDMSGIKPDGRNTNAEPVSEGVSVLVEGKAVEVRRFDPAELVTDADTFQFKGGGDASGVTDRLRDVGSWDPLAAGRVVVFERADGSLVVADGHQRHGLARRLKERDPSRQIEFDGYLFRASDGWTAADVRAHAAKKNLQEGSGTTLDAAKIMRERPDMIDDTVPLGSSQMRAALHLAELSDDGFAFVVGVDMEPGHAAIVGERVRDRSLHKALLGDIREAGLTSVDQVRLFVEQAMAAPRELRTQASLFGDEVEARSLVTERVRVLDKALKQLKGDKRIFEMLKRQQQRIEGEGNILDGDANAQAKDTAALLAESIERTAPNAGPVSNALNQAAEQVAAGVSVNKAAEGFVDTIRAQVEASGVAGLINAPAKKSQALTNQQRIDLQDEFDDLFEEYSNAVDEAGEPETIAQMEGRLDEIQEQLREPELNEPVPVAPEQTRQALDEFYDAFSAFKRKYPDDFSDDEMFSLRPEDIDAIRQSMDNEPVISRVGARLDRYETEIAELEAIYQKFRQIDDSKLPEAERERLDEQLGQIEETVERWLDDATNTENSFDQLHLEAYDKIGSLSERFDAAHDDMMARVEELSEYQNDLIEHHDLEEFFDARDEAGNSPPSPKYRELELTKFEDGVSVVQALTRDAENVEAYVKEAKAAFDSVERPAFDALTREQVIAKVDEIEAKAGAFDEIYMMERLRDITDTTQERFDSEMLKLYPDRFQALYERLDKLDDLMREDSVKAVEALRKKTDEMYSLRDQNNVETQLGSYTVDDASSSMWSRMFSSAGLSTARYPASFGSEGFAKFFEGSTVTTRDGKPLVVYHGSRADIETFKPGRGDLGFHFGTTKAASERLDITGHGRDPELERVYPVVLSIKKPVRVPDVVKFNEPENVAHALMRRGIISEELFKKIEALGWREAEEAANVLRADLQRQGYDGIVYRNMIEGKGADSWVAFEPGQVKSVFNRGDFDAQDPNIMYSLPQDAPQVDWSKSTTRLGDTDVRFIRRNDLVEVTTIKTDEAGRGKGSARAALETFLREADANGYRVALTPDDTLAPGIDIRRLTAFYESLGFKKNAGRNKDFETQASYIREPRTDEIFSLSADQANSPRSQDIQAESIDGARVAGNGSAVPSKGAYLVDDGASGVWRSMFKSLGLVGDRRAQYPRQFDSPQFTTWFGDSKVRNKAGNPLVVYHWTPNDFDRFKPGHGDIGAHFGTTKAARDRYKAISRVHDNDGGQTIPVVLSMQNPLRLPDVIDWRHPPTVAKALFKQKVLTRQQYDELRKYRDVERMEAAREFRWALKDAGYDGVIYRNSVEGKGTDSYIALDAGQIKSVFNRGTFDPKDPRYMYRLAGDDVHSHKPQAKAPPQLDAPAMKDMQAALEEAIAPYGGTLKLETVPDALSVRGMAVDGSYSPSLNRMRVSMLALDPMATFRHEEVHAVREMGLLTDAEWGALKRFVLDNDLIGKHKIKARYQKALGERYTDDIAIEEAIALMAENYHRGQRFDSLSNAALDRIWQFLKRLGSALRGRGYMTPNDVMQRIQSGEVARRLGDRPMKAGGVVYHGSRHAFDEFKNEKMLGGEGYMAFGPGLYFTETPSVARFYRNRGAIYDTPKLFYGDKYGIAGRVTFDGIDLHDHWVKTNWMATIPPERANQEIIKAHGEAAEEYRKTVPDSFKRNGNYTSVKSRFIEHMPDMMHYRTYGQWRRERLRMVDEAAYIDDGRYADDNIAYEMELVDYVDDLVATGRLKWTDLLNPRNGNFYEVDLKVPEWKMLDFDLGIDEQPFFVQQAIRKVFGDAYIDKPGMWDRFVHWVNNEYTPHDAKKDPKFPGEMGNWIKAKAGVQNEKGLGDKFRALMLANGVRGIRYKDGFSRNRGHGEYHDTSNFIVFDASDVTLRTRNGEEVNAGPSLDDELYALGKKPLYVPSTLQTVFDELQEAAGFIDPDNVARMSPEAQDVLRDVGAGDYSVFINNPDQLTKVLSYFEVAQRHRERGLNDSQVLSVEDIATLRQSGGLDAEEFAAMSDVEVFRQLGRTPFATPKAKAQAAEVYNWLVMLDAPPVERVASVGIDRVMQTLQSDVKTMHAMAKEAAEQSATPKPEPKQPKAEKPQPKEPEVDAQQPKGGGDDPEPQKAETSPGEPYAAAEKLRNEIEELEVYASLTRGELADIADGVIDKILGLPSGTMLTEARIPDLDFRGAPGPLKQRALTIPSKRIDNFLENDAELVARSYVRSIVPDLEITRQFGDVNMTDTLAKLKDEQAARIARVGKDPDLTQAQRDDKMQKMHGEYEAAQKDLLALVDRMSGRYKLPDDPDALSPRFFRTLRTLNLLRLLGGMTVSAIPDVARPMMTEGLTSWPGFVQLATNTQGRRGALEELRLSGTALDMVLDSRLLAMVDIGERYTKGSKVERAVDAMGSNFGIVSLMAPWNTAMKNWAGIVVMNRILGVAQKAAAGQKISAKDVEKAARSGIDVKGGMLERIAGQYQLHGGKERGVMLPNTEKWTDIDARDSFRAALARDVDRIVVTPGQDKPLWASTEFGKTVLQFKSFAISSAQRTLLAGLQDRDASFLFGSMMALGLGVVTEWTKNELNRKPHPKSTAQWAHAAWDRSGLNAYFSDINNVVEGMTRGHVGISKLTGKKLSRFASRNLTGSLMGPTFGLAQDVVDVTGLTTDTIFGSEDSKLSGSDYRKMRRVLPYQNLLYWGWLIRRFEESSGVNHRNL